MKNFISRDLNNTRYATRHIAEYLRKYFSFENSKNSNIKDVNRIRVLGGGIILKNAIGLVGVIIVIGM